MAVEDGLKGLGELRLSCFRSFLGDLGVNGCRNTSLDVSDQLKNICLALIDGERVLDNEPVGIGLSTYRIQKRIMCDRLYDLVLPTS